MVSFRTLRRWGNCNPPVPRTTTSYSGAISSMAVRCRLQNKKVEDCGGGRPLRRRVVERS
ncbi:hypothetical protein IG631_00978 [Alternaria alternata]|nr:hypothetical protein IG631_00978 [Alternaria alternata]